MLNTNNHLNTRSQNKGAITQNQYVVVKFDSCECGYFPEKRVKKFQEDDTCMLDFGTDGKHFGTILLTGYL